MVRIENGLAASRSASMIPRHQPVAALGPLVAVDVGAHRDVLARHDGAASSRRSSSADVDLDDDLRVEVVARVEVEVVVRLAGEAVVAHDAVGDEVAGAGGDVVHRERRRPRSSTATTSRRALRLDGEALEVPLAGDGRVAVTAGTASADGRPPATRTVRKPVGQGAGPRRRAGNPDLLECVTGPSDELVGACSRSAAPAGVAAFGIEDAGREARRYHCRPASLARRSRRGHACTAPRGRGRDRRDLLAHRGSRREDSNVEVRTPSSARKSRDRSSASWSASASRKRN